MGPVTYRNRGLRAAAIALSAFIALCCWLGSWSSTSFTAPLGAIIVGGALIGATYCAAIRPRLDLDDDGITITNPLSTRHLTWSQIATSGQNRGAVTLTTRDGRTIGLSASFQFATSDHGHSPYTDRVAADIDARLQHHRATARR
jgi:hypothetical protein